MAFLRRIFAGEVLKRLRTYDEGKEVVPGITAVGTHGHSAGHNSHVVSSGSSTVYVQADVTHVPFLFARNPGWHAFYDQDPIMAEETRRTTCWWRKRCWLPLSIPVACLCREEWIGLPRDSGALESDDLNAATALPRELWRAVAFPPARGRVCA